MSNNNTEPAATSSRALNYRDAGVDIDVGNAFIERIKPAVRSTRTPGVISGIGGFGALFELDLEKYQRPILISGTDGVGTKLMLARQLQCHQTIGIDLVAMCVNDILSSGAEPLFFLDYFACGKLDLDQASSVVEGIAEGCRQTGCALTGGETAEMPGMYPAGDYDLAGFTVGVVEKDKLIDGSNIRPGFALVGLGSSGPHSNGYSLIRKVIEHCQADLNAPLEGTGGTLGEALLAPTRIYVKNTLKLLQDFSIAGIAHITGGGLTENIVRILPEACGVDINLDSWQQPAVFKWLQENGNIANSEMLRTFNSGIGLVLIVEAEQATAICAAAEQLGEQAAIIGSVSTATNQQRVNYLGASAAPATPAR